MRVTNTLFYSTSVTEHQSAMKKLYDIDKQIASGMKIQNSFENSGVYVDTMRLNYEIATLEQTKESSSKAQTFAQNTDSTMNQFTKALEQFKTKLIQANNGSNSTTSLNAIANDLVSLKNHMISLGNTSINGQFIFSGTSLLQKPINLDGTYVGNGESLNALIGSGVELPYNLNGKDLFLGTDSDYNRIVSTNIPMFNQTKLHPEVMIEAGNVSGSQEVYLKETDTIRDMVGDTDVDATNDPQSVFYLSGRKSDGTTFSTKIAIDSDSKISSLLGNIGNAYGNTSTNKVVDVTMNAHGQIELKDLKTGNQLLEMHLFAAVDRDAPAGTAGNANQNIIDNIMAQPNVDIITFNKSNFDSLNALFTISSREDIFRPGTYYIGYPMKDLSGNIVNTTTTLSSFMPANVHHIDVNGTDISTAATVQTLMNEIQTQFGGTARLENGQIIVDGLTTSATLIAENALGASLEGFSIPDGLNYTRRGFEKEGNELISNISQIINKKPFDATKASHIGEYASAATTLYEVAGNSNLHGEKLEFEYRDTSGNPQKIILNLDSDDTTFWKDLNNDNSEDPNEKFSILNAKGENTKAKEMTYQQLTDLISMALADKLPQERISLHSNITTVLADSTNAAKVTAALGTTSNTETQKYIQEAIDYQIAANAGDLTAISKRDEALKMADVSEYGAKVKTAQSSVEVTLDYKGRIAIKDKTAFESKIEFSIYDSTANDYNVGSSGSVLSFMANDSVTISNPSIDFFKDLDAMIEAVRTGNFRMGTVDENPRNTGMQNALLQLDHILDHVTKEHTKIGAYTNALSDATDRAEYLSLNVKTVRSSVIDVDIAEAYLQFNQISNSYQAMLSTIAKINSMSLLNYM